MKKAIILFNLGGPDNKEAVKPFLFNLFNDKRIIGLPNPFRYFLAKFISSKREATAQEIYGFIGGKSPILEETTAQADALEKKLSSQTDEYKIFIVMRYWKPFANEVVKQVKEYNPDKVILLPLYPQFSTTTVASSFDDWNNNAKKVGLKIPTSAYCCYFKQDNFISSHVSLIKKSYDKALEISKPKILFSAHGLPQKIVDKGDSYQWQVEQTAKAIIDKLNKIYDNVDYQVCYQSKVGPLKWLEPNTEEVIENYAKEKVNMVIVPIAFVSEHSETLVELDIEYKEIADKNEAIGYFRVPTLGIEDNYIESLAKLCIADIAEDKIISNEIKRLCPKKFINCPNNLNIIN